MTAVLQVGAPGLFTTIQDLGRPGRRDCGVPPGGAMDRFAAAAANRLVGNPAGAAVLECMLTGPVLTATSPCLVAVTGADLGPSVNGVETPGWTSTWLREGDRLAFGPRRAGARTYIAVAGGLAADRWLGSASTYVLVGRGGLAGRQLKKGDELGLAGEPVRPAIAGRHLPGAGRPAYGREPVLEAIPGPHAQHLAPAATRRLWGEPWEISRDADRMGFRLEGEPLDLRADEMISFGLTMGCLQVPPSGKPILLMADAQTAGGYPVVAGVARVDLALAAQLLPGDRLRFRETTTAAAQERFRSLWSGLEVLA